MACVDLTNSSVFFSSYGSQWGAVGMALAAVWLWQSSASAMP